MEKNIVQVEIKRIPLDIEIKELGYVEIASLAANVEKKMQQIQKKGEIDTLKQALMAAMHFAAKAYLQTQTEGGKRKEDQARVNDLISKLKSALETPHD